MDSEKETYKQDAYDDSIPDPETEAPRDDEDEAVHRAVRRHHIPADEDVPNDCFSEKLL